MTETGAPAVVIPKARRGPAWVGVVLATIATLFLVWSAMGVAQGLWEVVGALLNETDDGVPVLAIAEAVVGIMGMAGAWYSLGRQKLAWASLFLVIQLPLPLFVGMGRCDVDCDQMGWARLPQAFYDWRIPIARRPQPPTSTLQAARPPTRHLTHTLNVYPAGAIVPAAFLEQAKSSDLGGVSNCFTSSQADTRCDAYVLDFYQAGAVDVLLVAPDDQIDGRLAGEIFKARPDGRWAKSAEIVVACADSMRALKEGKLTFTASSLRDVVLAGHRFALSPTDLPDCSRPAE